MIEVKEITTFFGEKLIHAGISLTLSTGKIHVLMGPSGGGKSSLLKLISSAGSLPKPGVTSGEVMVDNSTGGYESRFYVVLQKIGMFTRSGLDLLVEAVPNGGQYTRLEKEEIVWDRIQAYDIPLTNDLLKDSYSQFSQAKKTVLLCAIALLNDCDYVCLDEPTSNVNEQEAVEILEVIRKLRTAGKTVLVILHNQKHARYIADEIHLLAGGRIVESSKATDFFDAPTSEIAKTFLNTGSCSVPSPDSVPSELSDVGRLHKKIFNSSRPEPTGFYWLFPGRLAGCMRPGLLCTEEDDLEKLRKLGVDLLVSLEEEMHVSEEGLKAAGIGCIHFPIVDMRAPPDIQAFCDFLVQLQNLISANKTVAVHCKAGLGRTGTVLAGYVAFSEQDIKDPIAFIRQVNPRWIQSDEQEQFVRAFRDQFKVLGPNARQEIV